MTATSELPTELVTEFVVAAHNNFDKVKELLEQHPDLLNAVDPQGNETALAAASHIGQIEIAKYLLSKGAPLTICTAAALGMTEQVAKFLEDDPSQAQATGSHGIPLLAHAAISGKTEIAELLVQHGGGDGANIALTPASIFGKLEMAQWLLDHGADINTRNKQNMTPLTIAIKRGHTELAELYRQHGAVE
jgi:ankyrin repeat protein